MGTKTKVFFAGLGGMLFGGLLVSGFSKSRYVTTLERGSSRLGRYEIDRVIVNGANMRVSYTAKLWPGLTRRWDAESYTEARQILVDQAGELRVEWLKWPELADQD